MFGKKKTKEKKELSAVEKRAIQVYYDSELTVSFPNKIWVAVEQAQELKFQDKDTKDRASAYFIYFQDLYTGDQHVKILTSNEYHIIKEFVKGKKAHYIIMQANVSLLLYKDIIHGYHITTLDATSIITIDSREEYQYHKFVLTSLYKNYYQLCEGVKVC